MMKKTKLPEIIQAMKNPEIYPHSVKNIKFIQTQMSYVILTGDHVYKIKKPVNFGFLDYTTLEKRKNFCEREVELNRRLAPEIYLGVVSICDYNGKLNLDSGGAVIEYAVKMKELPAEKMLSALLKRRNATKGIIEKIAEKIAEFHQKAETGQEMAQYGNLRTIKKNCQENFEQTKKYIGTTIPQKSYQEIKSWTENFIADNKSLFEKRIKDGKIRDCHGDLQSDHICIINQREPAEAALSKGGISAELCSRPSEPQASDQRKSALNNKEFVDTSAIYIYDCIEFNERFRYGDVASEIAFLAMDLDFHGHAELSDYLVRSYIEETKDHDLLKLINFYKCYRAYVRGKVGSFKSDDLGVSQKDRRAAKELAKKYFKLAHSYIRQKPTLIIICGLSGTGKTTVAKILAPKTGFKYISSDVVRKKMAKIPLFEHREKEFGKGIYVPKFSQKTYKAMFKRAEDFLGKGKSVIIDATFKKREERQRVKNLAEKLGAKFLLIECRLSEKIIRKKMEERAKRKIVSDADWKIYLKQKKNFDKITEIPSKNHLVIDTSKLSDKKIIEKILEKIQGG